MFYTYKEVEPIEWAHPKHSFIKIQVRPLRILTLLIECQKFDFESTQTMRKLLFFIILMPAVMSLGHDVYFFTQNQDKGFHFSDVGALWDKYHKESHDQWKTNVQQFGETISDISPIDLSNSQPVPQNETSDSMPEFAQSFTQSDALNEETQVGALKKPDTVRKNVTGLQKTIGFLLEQKAILVFGGFALIVFLLNALFTKKEEEGIDKVDAWKKKNKDKKGGYKYSKR